MQKYLYKKTSKESYTIGVYTTIELLKARPESVIEVILSSKGERNKGIHKIIELCKKNKTPLKYNDNLVGKLTRSDNNYAVAIFKKYSADPTKHDNHLVLIKPSDMGNTGTIIRSMTAFNLTSLIIIKPAVDIFDPKTVRSSMGSLFGIKFRYFDHFYFIGGFVFGHFPTEKTIAIGAGLLLFVLPFLLRLLRYRTQARTYRRAGDTPDWAGGTNCERGIRCSHAKGHFRRPNHRAGDSGSHIRLGTGTFFRAFL